MWQESSVFSSVIELLKVSLSKDDTLSTVKTNISGKKQVNKYADFDCINKRYKSKMKSRGKMFRKKYQEKEKKDTFYSGHNPLAKEHQCWKRHHSAGVPSPFCKVC